MDLSATAFMERGDVAAEDREPGQSGLEQWDAEALVETREEERVGDVIQISQGLLVNVRGRIDIQLKQEMGRPVQTHSGAQLEQLRQVRDVCRVVGSGRAGDDEPA